MDPFIGEIRMFAGNYVPMGWLYCNGQSLSIAQFQALYAVIRTTYGGNGQTTFNLPNLCNKVPLHQGQGTNLTSRRIGDTGGEINVTLNANTMATHSHDVMCQNTSVGTDAGTSPANGVWTGTSNKLYVAPTTATNVAMSNQVIGSAGSNAPNGHNNLQPYLVVNYIIAYDGVWPEIPE